MNPTLVYCYDALCGWCYGFSPVMEQIRRDFAGSFQFEILSGGMMLGRRAGPIGEVAPFVRTAYKNVEQATGITFGEPFLKDLMQDGAMVMNSWKPSLALTAFKMAGAGDPFAFASALQQAVYREGLGPDLDSTYEKLARDWKLDPAAFLSAMQSPSNQELTRNEFRRVQQYGVSGFPTVLFDFGGDYAHFFSGYRPAEAIADALNKLLTPG